MPDAIKGIEAFGVDHYKPKKKFPQLASVYENLFYCCNHCNSFKKEFWPTPDLVLKNIFVPNPCEHKMFGHLNFSDGIVLSKSSAGKFTVDLLQLNEHETTKYRKGYAALLDVWKDRMKIIVSAKEKAAEKLRKGKISQADYDALMLKIEGAFVSAKLAGSVLGQS